MSNKENKEKRSWKLYAELFSVREFYSTLFYEVDIV